MISASFRYTQDPSMLLLKGLLSLFACEPTERGEVREILNLISIN